MGVDKVAASNFYKDKGDQIKLNWFLYEYSNILYTAIEECPKLAVYRKRHSEDDICAFCVYYSKRLKLSITNMLRRLVSTVTINARYVYEFYPGNSYAQTQSLIEAAAKAWDEHMLACSVCPNRCLTDGFERTDMFDNLEKTGWPTL